MTDNGVQKIIDLAAAEFGRGPVHEAAKKDLLAEIDNLRLDLKELGLSTEEIDAMIDMGCEKFSQHHQKKHD